MKKTFYINLKTHSQAFGYSVLWCQWCNQHEPYNYIDSGNLILQVICKGEEEYGHLVCDSRLSLEKDLQMARQGFCTSFLDPDTKSLSKSYFRCLNTRFRRGTVFSVFQSLWRDGWGAYINTVNGCDKIKCQYLKGSIILNHRRPVLPGHTIIPPTFLKFWPLWLYRIHIVWTFWFFNSFFYKAHTSISICTLEQEFTRYVA